MGNKAIKDEHNSLDELKEVIQNTCDHKQWVSKIKEQQILQLTKNTVNHIYTNHYNEFIESLMPNCKITGYSEVSIVSRLVRMFIGECYGVSVYNDSAGILKGAQISIAIHPITAALYIADEKTIYKIKKLQDGTNKLVQIAKAKQPINGRTIITDLGFDANGNNLVCMLNENIENVHYVSYKCNPDINDKKSQNIKKISINKVHDKMHIVKYQFNNYFLNNQHLMRYLNAYGVIPFLYHSHNATAADRRYRYGSSALHSLDPLRNSLWFIVEHCLYRIPLTRVLKADELYLSLLLSSVDDPNLEQYRLSINRERFEIQSKMQKVCEMMDTDAEVINWFELLDIQTKLKEFEKETGKTKTIEVKAFDIDKMFEAVYLITSDNWFYRIERDKGKDKNNTYLDDKSSIFSLQKNDWKLTHKSCLTKTLPNGIPLGLSTIRYDSVTGRLIIADNYQIQALYC